MSPQVAKNNPSLDPTELYKDLDTYYDLTIKKKKLEDQQAVLNKKIKKEMGVIRLGDLAELLVLDDDPDEAMRLLSSTKKRIENIVASDDYEKALKYSNFDYSISDRTAKIISQDQSKINTDNAVAFIRAKIKELESIDGPDIQTLTLLRECLRTKIVVDEEAIAEVINTGIFTPEEFKLECIDEKIIVTLRVVETKVE